MKTRHPDLVRQYPATYDPSGAERSSRRETLMATGQLVPAKLDLLELGPPVDQPHDVSISEALSELRSAS